MIRNSQQQWTPGAIVRVGFLTLRVLGVEAVVDGLPDIYTLESLDGAKRYRFIPHNGLERLPADRPLFPHFRACWEAGRPVAPKPPALHVGDPVEWRGGFGAHPPMIATVSAIEQTSRPGEKYGRDVIELAWPAVLAGLAVVTLTNGHWAYGYQLRPAPGMAAAVALARWEADQPTRRAHELATAGPLDPRD